MNAHLSAQDNDLHQARFSFLIWIDASSSSPTKKTIMAKTIWINAPTPQATPNPTPAASSKP
jgi:hypothetical protein